MAAYLDLAEVKAELGITSTSDDAVLTEIIDDVSKEIETRTHRYFKLESTHGQGPPQTTHSHYFTPWLQVYGGDLIDSYTLALNTDLFELVSITNGNGVAINLSNVVTLPINLPPPFNFIRIKRDANVIWEGSGEGSIAVTGKWGYSVTVPPDIRRAAMIMVRTYYQQREGSAGLGAPLISADGVVIQAGQTMSDAMRILKAYIRRS
jgi:hypothetical protein